MAKLNISNAEFNMICSTFKAPKAGEHICWRDFCDCVDEVFTKKGLEKDIDKPLDNARTQTLYGPPPPPRTSLPRSRPSSAVSPK